MKVMQQYNKYTNNCKKTQFIKEKVRHRLTCTPAYALFTKTSSLPFCSRWTRSNSSLMSSSLDESHTTGRHWPPRSVTCNTRFFDQKSVLFRLIIHSSTRCPVQALTDKSNFPTASIDMLFWSWDMARMPFSLDKSLLDFRFTLSPPLMSYFLI